jgi:hypothetical protein
MVLWVLMVGIYYLLAKDEERRMLKQFDDQYRQYMMRTGMFLPRAIERIGERIPLPRSNLLRSAFGFVLLAVLTIGATFALRAYTISQLPLWSEGRVTAMAILPSDTMMLDHRMADILKLPTLQSRLDQVSGPILVYLMPRQYVMQGMIADTGPQWRLYRHHGTAAMITEWIFHPFRHIQGSHTMMRHHEGSEPSPITPAGAVVRRLIFLRIDSSQPVEKPGLLFGINSHRVPLFFADVDVHNVTLLNVRTLGPGTGWGSVPTPMF